jgi:DNA-binding response OmpR family regulator
MHTAANPVAKTKPEILICDDDIEFSNELIEALAARGFQATALLTVSAMRAAILSPSILLLDLCMPDRDGIEILDILAKHERKSHFKIVLVSGWDERMLETAAKLCTLRGLELLGVFRKPIALQPLCALLDEAIFA